MAHVYAELSTGGIDVTLQYEIVRRKRVRRREILESDQQKHWCSYFEHGVAFATVSIKLKNMHLMLVRGSQLKPTSVHEPSLST